MLTTYDMIKVNIIQKYIKNNIPCINNKKDDLIIDDHDLIEIINKKLQFTIYNKINNTSDQNTLLYLFNHISSGIFIKIQDNKLIAYHPFENKYYKNNWSSNIKLYVPNNKNPTLEQFINYRKFILKKYKKYIYNIQFWHANANIINNEKYDPNDNYIPHSINDYKDLIIETLKYYNINDLTVFINKRDSCVLHKDLLEPYPSLYPRNVDSLPPKLEDKYQNLYYTPVLSPYSNKNYADIPFIIPEDWKLANNENNYHISQFDIVDWNSKIPTAIFRGACTGPVEFKYNQRLQISKLDSEWQITKPGLIDAGIVSWNLRDKIDSNLTITYINPQDMNSIGINLRSRIDMNKQLKYKYIINIDGHSATNRFSYLLQSGCLILNVESEYVIGNERWYDHLLKPYVHYIPIKYDFSDLETNILWCRNNDDKCKKIVENAKQLYNKYFTKEGIMKYTSLVLNSISKKNDC